MKKLYVIFTAIIIGFPPYVSFAGGGGGDSCNIQLGPGWNLVGSTAGTASVSSLFSDKTKVLTVWKWLSVNRNWAFYTPQPMPMAERPMRRAKATNSLPVLLVAKGFG